MLSARVLSACVVVLAATSAFAEIEEEEHVLIGTADNFENILNNKFVLVEFYAPWCGHCKQLAPEYAEAATTLHEEKSDVKLCKIDATENEELAQQYDVSGFPTLKWFKKGKDTEYTGGRTADEMVKWVTKKSGPPAVPCKTVEDCKKLKDEGGVVVFGFFEENTEAGIESPYQAFLSAAEASDFTFVVAFTADLIGEEFGVTAPALRVYTDFDEGEFVYEGEWEEEDITEFVAGNSMPLVTEFNEEVAPKIFGGAIKVHFLIFANFDSENWDQIKADFTQVAKGHKGKMLFITMDVNKEDNGRILEFFTITAADAPTYRIISIGDEMKKFQPKTNDVDQASLDKFATDFQSGDLSEHLNSERTPDGWDAQPVKVLTGGNFAEVAMDTSKNAFVEFYAPWCGHCKQLAPIFDELAAAFEDVSNVVIGKIDATQNDVKDVKVESFPTLKLFPAGEAAEVIDFDGDRTLAGMTAFLNEKCGASVVVADDAPEDAEGAGEGAGEGADEGADEKHDEL